MQPSPGSIAFTEAGQRWWQGLPVDPTGWGGDSPYQSLSSFAGNGLLLSPDCLMQDGLLRDGDCDERFPSLFVDYETVIPYSSRWRWRCPLNTLVPPLFEALRELTVTSRR